MISNLNVNINAILHLKKKKNIIMINENFSIPTYVKANTTITMRTGFGTLAVKPPRVKAVSGQVTSMTSTK